jgi:hypothetical protein
LIILRRWQKEVGIGVKYPMLFVEPNCVPDLKFTLVALTHGELINILLTSSGVYEVVLTVIDCEKEEKNIKIPRITTFHLLIIYELLKIRFIKQYFSI